MKRIFTLFIIFSFFSFNFSQTVQLQWEGSKVIDFGSYQVAVPFFKNNGFAYEESSVYYRTSAKYSGTDQTVTNLLWEKITPKELYEISLSSIPTEEKTEISVFTNPYTNEKSTNIRVSALKVEKENIYRLISFSIVNSAVAKSRSSVSQKTGSTENPLKSGNFYKIKVDTSGVFKITAKFLRDNGINPSNINPKNFRIYGNGGLMLPEHNQDTRYSALQENAIQVTGEADGVWNDDDYALFYAQGPHGFNVYKTSGDTNGSGNRRRETRTDKSSNFINIYSDFAYYFINFDLGPGKRIPETDLPVTADAITRYDEYQYINEEKFNLMKIGRIWTGDAFTENKTVTFTTRSPIQPTDVIRYRSRYIGYLSSGNKITADLNNQNPYPYTISPADRREYVPIVYTGTVTNLQGNQLAFNYAPDTSANPNGKFYFDYAEVQYKEDLKFNNSQMNFRSYSIAE
ncbi:MAG: type IX secretion system sortase PorU, long form, partial [Kaistella sp.]